MIIDVVKDFQKGGIYVLIFKNKNSTHLFLNFLDKEDKNYILNFLKKNDLRSLKETLIILPSGKEALLIGGEEKEKFNHRKTIKLARRIIVVAKKFKKLQLVICFDDFKSKDFIDDKKLVEVLATQFELANFEFIDYKEKPIQGWFFVQKIGIYFGQNKDLNIFKKHLNIGKIIGEEINLARKLINAPGGDMTPLKLAQEAKKASKIKGLKVKVLEEKQIAKIGMGGILGVCRGSSEKPQFIIMEYFGASQKEKPIVLIGKGVTFDSGGLNLKPTDGIYEMHMDMAGGGAVIYILKILAKLGLRKNIVGIVPAVENMPSGSSYRPGDLLKSLSGKTIEVLNTDAEGRIILADALSYAQKFYSPSLIIDIATLTGAAMIALGLRASAVFSNKSDLISKIQVAGEESGDFVWPLPLWEEYEEDIKGTFGDVANAGKTRYGGAIIGAMFLYQFIKNEKGEIPWIHLDIAPRMTSIEGDFLAKGATGFSVSLLVNFIRNFL